MSKASSAYWIVAVPLDHRAPSWPAADHGDVDAPDGLICRLTGFHGRVSFDCTSLLSESFVTAEVLERTALPSQDATAPTASTMSAELRRRWPLLLAVMLGMCFGTAGQSYWFGALVGPMTRANGWTLSEISSWTAFACVAGLMVKPVAGWLAGQDGA